MYTINVEVKLFSFNELSEKSKEIAIQNHREFELKVMSPKDFISGDEEYDTKEKLQKQYELKYNYYLENDEPIIENIEINEYLFFEDGKLANCTTYMKGNKEIKTVLNFNNKEYLVK